MRLPAVWGLGGSATAGQIMDRHRGAGPGFDLWRIGLSLAVILLHSFHVAYGDAPYLASGPTGPFWAVILPIFFALSGFLVTGSAVRNPLNVFIAFRVLRIVPALVTEVTLAALLLGPLLTTLPLREYFSHPQFLVYFGNIIGWVHFELPGVFDGNPQAGIVNRNLWTLHPELMCYAVMAAMIVTGLIARRNTLTALWALGTVAALIINAATGQWELNGVYGSPVLVYYFLTGVVAYHWRHRIPVALPLFLAAVVISYMLLRLPHTTFLAAPFVTYIMVWVGMQPMPKVGFLQTGDYSYGLYLYAYPVQQTVAQLLPWSHEWWLNFLISTPIALGIAMLSWHLVEKPALTLKRFVVPAKPKAPALAHVA